MAPAKKTASVERSPVSGPPLYFSVIYADNKTAMFNIACQKEHLVSAIRRRCRLERQVEIDLWTTRGELVKLTDRSDQDSLDDVIRNRDIAVLCKLEASKFPGVESRLVPLINDLHSYPALRELADGINQQVSDREAKIALKQQSVMKRTPRYSSAQQQSEDGSEASSMGMMKGRMAIKRIMIINKMTKRA